MSQQDNDRQRLLLATIAAEGILQYWDGVGGDGAVHASGILGMLPFATEGELQADLAELVSLGLLRKDNSGYNGYGDQWVDGSDYWRVTPAGLVALWMIRP